MKIKCVFLKIIHPFSLVIIGLLLYNCNNANQAKVPNEYRNKVIVFDKNDIIMDALKSEVSVKTSKSNEGMEISGVYTIIANDTTFIQNGKVAQENCFGDKKQYTQYFYYYRDTIYGDWFTAIHKKRKIFVKLDQNATGIPRKLIIALEDGDDYGSVCVTQEAK